MEEGVIQVTNSLGDVVRFDRHALPSRVVVWPIKLARSDHNFAPIWDGPYETLASYGTKIRWAGSTRGRAVVLIEPEKELGN